MSKKLEEKKDMVEATYDADGVQVSAAIDWRGMELGDPVPVEVPAHMKQAPALDALVQQFVRNEMSRLAAEQEFETFEEADDFEIEDDPVDQLTPYEKVFEPPKVTAPSSKGVPPAAAEGSQKAPPSDASEPAAEAPKPSAKPEKAK